MRECSLLSSLPNFSQLVSGSHLLLGKQLELSSCRSPSETQPATLCASVHVLPLGCDAVTSQYKSVSTCVSVPVSDRVRKGCLCMSAKLCVKRRLRSDVQWAVPLWAVGGPLVCVREMQCHRQNGYMEPFTFTDMGTDMDTCTWGHPMSMTGDPEISRTQTCTHAHVDTA